MTVSVDAVVYYRVSNPTMVSGVMVMVMVMVRVPNPTMVRRKSQDDGDDGDCKGDDDLISTTECQTLRW